MAFDDFEYNMRTGRYERIRPESPLVVGRVYAQQIRIDRMGYDRHGRYWGTGEKLYYVTDDEHEQWYRAPSAAAAKAMFLARRNPLSSSTLLVGLGALVLGGIAYAVYKKSQTTQALPQGTPSVTPASQQTPVYMGEV